MGVVAAFISIKNVTRSVGIRALDPVLNFVDLNIVNSNISLFRKADPFLELKPCSFQSPNVTKEFCNRTLLKILCRPPDGSKLFDAKL